MKQLLTYFLLALAFLSFGGEAIFAQNLKRSPARTVLENGAQRVSSNPDMPSTALYHKWIFNNWDTITQTTNLYSVSGYLLEEQVEAFHNSQFEPSFTNFFDYNSNGNQTEHIVQVWNGTALVDSARKTFSYDTLSNLLEMKSYSRSMSSWVWDGGMRYAYTYDLANQLIEKVTEIYNSGSSTYALDSKVETQWSQGEWSQLEDFDWSGSAWVPKERTVDIVWYDFSRQLLSSMKKQQYANSAYIDDIRGTCTYTQNDTEDWVYEKYQNGSWTNSLREIRRYNVFGLETEFSYYSWYSPLASWKLGEFFSKYHITDGQHRIMETVIEIRDSINPNPRNFERFVYGSFFVGLDAPSGPEEEASAFPNPASNQLNFDWNLGFNSPVVIALFDAQGRKRLETLTNYNGNTISIPISSQLENGTYFYQLKSGDSFAKGKVIVQH